MVKKTKVQSSKRAKSGVIASGKAKWYTGKGLVVAAVMLMFVAGVGWFGAKLYQQSGAHAAVCNGRIGCPLAIGNHSVVTNGNIYVGNVFYNASGSKIFNDGSYKNRGWSGRVFGYGDDGVSGYPYLGYPYDGISASPSGNRVVFSMSKYKLVGNTVTSTSAAYVAKSDLTGAIQISPDFDNTTMWYALLNWSPDGRRIAVSQVVPQGTAGSYQSTIHIINPDGGGDTLVPNTTTNTTYNSIGWISPDKLVLAGYTDTDGGLRPEVCTLQTDGSAKSCITLDNHRLTNMKVSPDGTQLVGIGSTRYLAEGGIGWDIFVSDVNGQNIRQLTHFTGSESADFPTWSPDGSSIIYRYLIGQSTSGSKTNIVNKDGSNNRVFIADDSGPSLWLPRFKCQSNPFTDVTTTTPFCVEIDWAVTNGITTGNGDGTFKPTNLVTRGDMAAFLYNRARLSDTSLPANPICSTQPFKDIPTSHPLCGQIKWIKDKGITTGYPDGTYQPSGSITRDAMSAFLYRAEHPGQPEPTCTKAPFKDVSISTPFCGAINWMAQQGITTGYDDGTFKPLNTVTRDAMMAFIYRTTVH